MEPRSGQGTPAPRFEVTEKNIYDKLMFGFSAGNRIAKMTLNEEESDMEQRSGNAAHADIAVYENRAMQEHRHHGKSSGKTT